VNLCSLHQQKFILVCFSPMMNKGLIFFFYDNGLYFSFCNKCLLFEESAADFDCMV
jgi:hypothetical protein